jgi:tetratricopeptide (TPR) repeat protein
VIAHGSPEDLKASPNGRHILAVTEHSTIRRFDLAEVTSDDGEPLDELLRMAQLASGQQVFQGEVSGLSADEWDRLWAGRPHRAQAPVAVATDQPLEPGLPDDWIAKARELVSNGDTEAAVTAITRAVVLSTLKTVQAAIASDRIAWGGVLDELCRQHPQDEAYLRWRCDFHTSHGNWKQAAQAQAALVAHKPGDYFNYFLAAPLQLIAGDVAGYRDTCRMMLERFHGSAEQDPHRAEQLSKTCLLAPGAVSDIDAVWRLAERAVTGTEKDPGYAWFVLARALAHYRQEQFTEAQERLTEYVARAAANESISRNAMARALLAMTQARLGQLEDAKKSLESARQMVSQVIPHPEEGRFFSGDWSDWVRCLILLSEAEQVVGRGE